MAKIRLQTRYTLLCYIIQFTASRLKGHIRKEQTAFLVGQGIEKRFADEILRVCGVFAAFSEYILLFKFFLCHDIIPHFPLNTGKKLYSP